MNENVTFSSSTLQAMLKDARQRTLELILDLGDDQLMGPRLDIVNPLLWEIGHVAFFHEVFVLRELGATDRLLEGAEELYDSFQVAHDLRWDLLLPDRQKTLAYAQTIMDRMMERLESHDPTAQETYLYLLAVFHEDMHGEAFTWTRQTLEYPAPRYAKRCESDGVGDTQSTGDVEIPGGIYRLGAEPHQPFVFDNEKWCHDVKLAPFHISRTAVTNFQFAEFVEDGGYDRADLWSYSGRTWLEQNGPKHPVYWQKANGNWMHRHFDTLLPMREHDSVIHVNWYEAEAYCTWAGRRLPTETEWEMVASMASGAEGKPMYAWGDETPSARHANLDGTAMGCVDVSACAEGDSPSGCRQMIGNVWEWTSSAFYPFPGYVVDRPYREYSAPWFGYNKVLKGGSWATRSRLIRNTYRNFALPHRCDVFAGFRTCATPA